MDAFGRRVLMAVSNDLLTDQRVARSCAALTEAGYRVTLVGRRLDDPRALERPYRTVRLRLLFRKGPLFYAELNWRLFFWMLVRKADLIYANDTDTLLACYLAARMHGKPLFFDAHELFPEVPELQGRRGVQRVWRAIERHVLSRLGRRYRGAAVTVTASIADYYRDRYGVTMAVVRNVPDTMPERPDNALRRLPDGLAERLQLDGATRLLLYQGAVNDGRCIDWLIDAMEYLPDCRLAIAGTGDLDMTLRRYAESLPWANRVVFLGRLEPEVLRRLTPCADLGLVLMENKGLNYYYSFPNRVGDFVAAGVPMVVSDFPELRRFMDAYAVGCLVDTDSRPDAEQLATVLRDAVETWRQLPDEERACRMDKAREALDWQVDKKSLLDAVDAIFSVR